MLLKSIKIFDKQSKYHLQIVDILIESGVVKEIGTQLKVPSKVKEFQKDSWCISPSWVDANFHVFEPGNEYREDFNSGLQAAARAGFGYLAVMPNTNPPVDNSSRLAFAQQAVKSMLSDIVQLGAVSQGISGKDIAELYDMYQHGAIAFTDGSESIQDAGLMERALWYVKKFDGLIMNSPDDKNISLKGQMNEGVNSTRLGLSAAPKLAEELTVARDLYLLEHTGSRLHFTALSTAQSVELVRKAKKKGLKVTAGVNVANLFFKDEELLTYDTNFKVKPHLRELEDVKALLKGLKDGTIDVINSGHTPLHQDEKKVEFDHAEFGMSTIDCTFEAARTATNKVLSEEELIEKFTNAYSILTMPRPKIEVGQKADFTLFNLDSKSVFKEEDILSRGKNNPFIDNDLQGLVYGLIKGSKTNMI